MKIAGTQPSSQEIRSSKQLSLDTHESELRKQITNLREEKKSISNDKNKTNEEKKKEKQAVQEEIQSLSSELRQYQIQKRQEEAAKKQEALKEAAKDREAGEQAAEEEQIPAATIFGNEESGVLISLSATKKQIRGMSRTLNILKRKQGTAATEEEKADIQKKINNAARNIGRKITITEDSVTKTPNSKKKSTQSGQQLSDQPFNWKKTPEIVTAAEDSEEFYGGNLIANRKKFFSTVSIFIK
ncbi:MAG: FlxA-like family protein [Blautia sp.]|nr:FlxA-like family protein [Blautia sp.]